MVFSSPVNTRGVALMIVGKTLVVLIDAILYYYISI